ncbi:glutathione binding-like protein [Nereida sp. MMG025]|uniref:glutathione S-transferase family protein n=1 Tax=Nereida sp. MMG025 TaxID=2909981 RepID=UPI00351D7669|nr:glutathione S-transferase family protein [Nereida sp. MMG025]
MTIKLYCFGESGNAYKAALSLEMAGMDWQPVFVDFFKGAARSDDFKKLNPMGEVPVMVNGDLTLTQSGVIQQYVVDQTGKLGSDDRYELQRWLLWDNHKMSSQAGVLRFMTNFLPPEKRNADVNAFLTGRFKAALSVLDTHLTDRDWMVGDALSIADIANCAYLYYPEPYGFDRSDYPAIDAWLTRISDQPRWKHPYDLMQRALPASPE